MSWQQILYTSLSLLFVNTSKPRMLIPESSQSLVKAMSLYLTLSSAMQTADSDGVYKSLEDLFSDVQLITAEAARALQSTTEASLSLVCDAKVAGSETYYRLNDTKVTTGEYCFLAGESSVKIDFLIPLIQLCMVQHWWLTCTCACDNLFASQPKAFYCFQGKYWICNAGKGLVEMQDAACCRCSECQRQPIWWHGPPCSSALCNRTAWRISQPEANRSLESILQPPGIRYLEMNPMIASPLWRIGLLPELVVWGAQLHCAS